jgi:large conductance mechanosensitive channel
VAFAIFFFIVKPLNALKKKEDAQKEATPAAPPREQVLLEEIRDLLKNQK